MSKFVLFFIVIICVGAVSNGAYSQSFTPVAVTGFNADIVAEVGTNAFAKTSTDIDATQHVIYTQTFAATNAIGGGVPDNGLVVSGTHTFQMAAFDDNNAVYLATDPTVTTAVSTRTLTLTSPAAYSKVSLLMFGTEGGGTFTTVFNFTDGTSASAGVVTGPDWYSGSGNVVLSSFGRIARLTGGTYTADGLSGQLSKMFGVDILVPCAKQAVPLASITVTWNTGSLSARFVIMAVAGVAFKAPTFTPTIVDATCGNPNGSIAMAVADGSPTYRFSWNTTPVQVTSSISSLAANTYTVTITDANACQTVLTETVKATPVAVVTAAASPAVICSGQSSILSAVSTGPAVTGYAWSPAAGSGSSVTVSPTATTTYTVAGTDANGCAVSSSVEVTIKPAPDAPFTVAPDTICQGSTEAVTYTGTVSATATYNWFGFGGGTVQSGSGAGPYVVAFNTPGTISVQLQVSDQGCNSAVTTQQFIVSEKPSPSFTVSDVSVCAGQQVLVTYTGTSPGATTPVWSWDGGSAIGKGLGPYNVKFYSTGTISLTVTNGGCVVDAAPITVDVTPQPKATFVPDPGTGCAPLTVSFDNETKNADSYTWDFGDGGSSTEQNPVHVYTATGSYSVSLSTSNSNKCFSAITLTDIIHVSSRPTLDFSSTPDSNVEVQLRDATYSFTNLSMGARSYVWKFGDGDSSVDNDPTHRYHMTGNFIVTLYGFNDGCEDSVIHRFYEVIPDKEIRIPNAFSPNGDGVNDVWEIDDLKEFPDCRVSIFNRWGQELYRSTGYDRPWDGRYGGKPVPVATYYYVIEVPGRKVYSGWVMLLK